jgi:anti-sigma factor RsiW
MDCPNAQNLLDAYLDGELDALRSSEIADHLHGCADCTQSLEERQTIRSRLKSPSLYFKAPDTLQKSIRHSLRQAAKAESPSGWFNAPWLKIAMPAAAAALVLVTLMPIFRAPGSNRLADEAVGNHVRSLMVNHLADVASTDEHTVKPWFNGKVNFSPPVADLVKQGFPLIGGRLDYLDNQPVAALVYQRDKHIINVFVWPSASSREIDSSTSNQQGYHVIRWTSVGFNFCAVSDLEINQLKQFTALLTAPPPDAAR